MTLDQAIEYSLPRLELMSSAARRIKARDAALSLRVNSAAAISAWGEAGPHNSLAAELKKAVLE